MTLTDEELGVLITGGTLPAHRMRKLRADPAEARRAAQLVMLASKIELLSHGDAPTVSLWSRGTWMLKVIIVLASIALDAALAFPTSYTMGWIDRWADAQLSLVWMTIALGVVLFAITKFVWPRVTHRPAGASSLLLTLAAFGMGAAVLWAGAGLARSRRADAIDALLRDHIWCAVDPPGFNPYTNSVPDELQIAASLKALGGVENSGRRLSGLITFRASGMGSTAQIAKEQAGFDAVILGLRVEDDAATPGSPGAALLESEMRTAIAAAPWVDAYCVGHNPSSTVTYEQLAAWMARLRRETGKPVTTTLPLSYYLGERGARLRRLGDFAFVDVVPPFHGGITPAAAVAHIRGALRDVQDLPPGKPVLLKMVSYPSAGGPGLSENNQNEFYRDLFHGVFFPPEVYVSVFAGYDVEWKRGPDWDEAEVHIGLMTTAGRKKPALDTVLQLWPTRRRE